MAARCAELSKSFCSMAPLTPLSPPGAAGLVGLIVWAPAFNAPRQQPISAAASVRGNEPRSFIGCSLAALLGPQARALLAAACGASFLPELLTRSLSRNSLHGDTGYRINNQDTVGFVDITIDDRLRCYRSSNNGRGRNRGR